MTRQRGKYPVDYITADQAMDSMKDAPDMVQGYAVQIGKQAIQYGEKAQEAALQYRAFVEKSLRERPMTTLAGAAVIGFILGALWRK